jgi:hypothetical protein
MRRASRRRGVGASNHGRYLSVAVGNWRRHSLCEVRAVGAGARAELPLQLTELFARGRLIRAARVSANMLVETTLPRCQFRKVVIESVIVRFVRNKDVLLHRDSGGGVQGAGGDAGGIAVELAPKQVAAAGAAEAAFRRGRGLIPGEGLRRF